jgi:hypothetical protein
MNGSPLATPRGEERRDELYDEMSKVRRYADPGASKPFAFLRAGVDGQRERKGVAICDCGYPRGDASGWRRGRLQGLFGINGWNKRGLSGRLILRSDGREAPAASRCRAGAGELDGGTR